MALDAVRLRRVEDGGVCVPRCVLLQVGVELIWRIVGSEDRLPVALIRVEDGLLLDGGGRGRRRGRRLFLPSTARRQPHCRANKEDGPAAISAKTHRTPCTRSRVPDGWEPAWTPVLTVCGETRTCHANWA